MSFKKGMKNIGSWLNKTVKEAKEKQHVHRREQIQSYHEKARVMRAEAEYLKAQRQVKDLQASNTGGFANTPPVSLKFRRV